jgi:hypothetical protein
MTSRKKPGVAFWATVIVVVVLAYPLSFGPAMWLGSRDLLPTWLGEIGDYFYAPLERLRVHGPKPIGDALFWWEFLWIAPPHGPPP